MRSVRHRYCGHLLLIIIIIFDPGTQFPGNEKLRYAIQKSTKIKLE